MSRPPCLLVWSLGLLGMLADWPTATAGETVFTEDFATAANWVSGAFTPVDLQPSGGPDDSSYIQVTASFQEIGQGTVFRAHAAFDASGDAFVGDWIENGYREFSVFVRHDVPVPVNYFARFAPATNFPGAGVVAFVPVLPDTWTELKFDVGRGSPQIVALEGGDYESIFSNLGNIQIAADAPAGFEDDPTRFRFDLDKASIAVPEPGALTLAASVLFVMGARRRAGGGRVSQ